MPPTMETLTKRVAKLERQMEKLHPAVDPDTVLSAADRAALKSLHHAEREGKLVSLEDVKRARTR